MIKRHLIGCSVLLLLTIMSIVYRSSVKRELLKKPLLIKSSVIKIEKSNTVEEEKKDVSLDFADEKIPLHIPKVAVKMHHTIRVNKLEKTENKKLQRKADKFFPIIEPILAKYGIPKDFKYIPLVESGFEKATSSHRGASGYWQFMPQTARNYGLVVVEGVDERSDIRKSTVAACKYFQELHKIFKNWTLVAAAYNYGEGKLWAQMLRQKKYNYYKLKLNRETGSYVYKLVSMKEIIENQDERGYVASRRILNTRAKEPLAYINPHIEKSTIAGFHILRN